MHDHDLTTLIRLYVDDELDAGSRRDLEERLGADPELRHAVAFERSLAERVAESLGDAPAAPAALVESVRSSLAAEAAPAKQRMRFMDWLESPHRANVAAVAASLLLVVGAVLWGVFGKSIDRISPHVRSPLVVDVAGYASQEHSRCANDRDARTGKAAIAPELVGDALEKHLGAPVAVADLSDFGYELLGGGYCMVPGSSCSAHLMYVREPTRVRPGALASIFIVPDEGQFESGPAMRTLPGDWLDAPGGPECHHTVLTAEDGSLVYFLVCCDERDMEPVSERVAEAIRRNVAPVDPSFR